MAAGSTPAARSRRDQHQVAAALGHLVAVPADHPGVHVVPGEAALPGHAFGVRGGELVVREDQIAAAALDVEPETDAAQRNCRALDVPARPSRAERRRPTRLTGPLRAPQQRVERVGLAGPLRVAPSLGEQPQHGVAVVVGLVAELPRRRRPGSRHPGAADRRRRRRHRRPAASPPSRPLRRWPRWRRRSPAAATPAAPSCPRGTGRSPGRRDRASRCRRASARSNSGSSTSVTFWT